ncbi:hypothetical protein [Streptomyces sp. NPDC059783]|uniref:hypothetical protein n=1 Tax=Streptomyces sp. NPDC059783 TaxID=3346944 RepID=UPI00364622C3
MSAPDVIIDASNIAHGRGGTVSFARVVDVREAWLREHPGSYPYAVLDGAVRGRLEDRALADRAGREHWLELHQGDADDRILSLAAQYGAAVISEDNFRFARREHTWLQGNTDRIWSARRVRGRVVFSRRSLSVATDEEIDADRARKRGKAGLRDPDSELRFRHVEEPSPCRRSGSVLTPPQVYASGDRLYCHSCDQPAEETVAEAPVPETPDGRTVITVMHGYAVLRTVDVPGDDGLVIGRASRSRPGTTDVTDGLGPEARGEISREHVRIFLDDDGRPMAEHLTDNNASFLNPVLDRYGRPSTARLATRTPYGLEPGDELVLGTGSVRLRISEGSSEGDGDGDGDGGGAGGGAW